MPHSRHFAESPEDVALDPERLEGLLERAEQEVAQGRLPSCQLAVARNGRLAVLASFSVYALLLAPLGFLMSTTLVVTTLSLVFAGPPGRSLASAAILSGVMYLVFVYGLGLSLPLGTLFLARGGG